jgi:peptidoglycan/xylan/chitin deacetylase (PgdA/CDA1 family)
MTVDVENYSIPLNRYDDATGEEICNSTLPYLLQLFSKYNVNATFYFTGEFVEKFPGSVSMVLESNDNHEVACHGYTHNIHRAFDTLPFDQQVKELEKARQLLDKLSRNKVKSFRAPALRINEATVKALETTGFTTDSSVCSQRFDGPLTFGSKRKLKWLFAPRMPYYLSYSSIIHSGSSKVLEVPVSALIVPYIGTFMRMAPMLFRILQRALFREAIKKDKPLVFLYHPNEAVEVNVPIVRTQRADYLLGYLFGDRFRQRLKLKNLGSYSLILLEDVLRYAKHRGANFITMQAYWELYRNR